MKVVVYDQDGEVTELNNLTARTLMEAIRDASLNLAAQCGGCASCGTCHVYVDDAWRAKLNPPTSVERDMLDMAAEPRENSRLSCQVNLSPELDGLVVTLAPDSGFQWT